ncbi:MAG: rhodanese-like domain-containing protein, partial [Pseudomonadota bacterium]|nr:rhodanese-like domain-containing protein [Pseudomonadota bacterium]
MPQGFTHPEFLVETQWLAAHLDDPTVLVFDCTTHLIPDPKITYQVVPGREDFERGHIPGAQFIDLQADLSDNARRLRFMAPRSEEFAAAMRRLGVSDDSRVVLYSTANVWWATRVWWLLRVFGFDRAAVLNGGFQKWAREQRPAEAGPARSRAPGDFTARTTRPLMVGKDEV